VSTESDHNHVWLSHPLRAHEVLLEIPKQGTPPRETILEWLCCTLPGSFLRLTDGLVLFCIA
jgi:hypothetical protein